MLGNRPQNPRIPAELAVVKRGYRAPRGRIGHPQANFVADGHGSTDPLVLDEAALAGSGFDHHIGTEPPLVELLLGVEFREARQG